MNDVNALTEERSPFRTREDRRPRIGIRRYERMPREGDRLRRILLLLSFLVPLCFMIICMIAYEVQPFGDKSLMIIDALHQYMPFFSVLYDKLHEGGSLFYSWRAGLGINFLSLMAYYLMSPLNLLIFFFKRVQLNMIVSMILVLKIALSGLAMGIYCNERSREPNPFIVACAAAYALNSYMVGYCWNVMWLDAIMVLPLILLGIERLIRNNDGKLYCLSLFYALFCNYYIGYMICIFCVFWFFLGHFDSLAVFIRRGLSFALYSLLAGGMAAIILLPAYLGIRQTAAGTGIEFPGHEMLTSLPALLNRQIDLTMPITHDNEFDGNANLYTGIFVLVLLVFYMANRNIKLADKIRKCILIAFFYLSFAERNINFIWHGFHSQYGIPNRFSFLLGILLIIMAFEVMEQADAICIWHVPLALGLCALYLGGLRFFSSEPLDDGIYIIVGILMATYLLIILLHLLLKQKRKRLFKIAFSLIVVAEMGASCLRGFYEIGQIDVPKFYSYTEDMEEAIKGNDDGTFYRSEVVHALMLDEAIYYPMNTVGLFGSTASENMVDVMDQLGFSTGANEYKYIGQTVLTNYLFGVRYQYFKDTDDVTTEFTYKDSYGAINVYENPVKTSVGYMVNESIEDYFDTLTVYPFESMNDLAFYAWGVENLFKNISIPEPMIEGCSAEATGSSGEYRFYFEEAKDDNLTFNIPLKEGADDLYFYYDGTQVSKAVISLNGRDLASGDLNGSMVYIGDVDEDSWLMVKMSLKGEEETGIVRLSAASMNQKKFQKIVSEGEENAFRVTSYTDRSMEGTVTVHAEESGHDFLFLSVPYDKGWTLMVDGKRKRPVKVGDAFMGISLEDGDHTISLTYVSPGFHTGLLISLVSLAVFVILSLVKAIWRGVRRN